MCYPTAAELEIEDGRSPTAENFGEEDEDDAASYVDDDDEEEDDEVAATSAICCRLGMTRLFDNAVEKEMHQAATDHGGAGTGTAQQSNTDANEQISTVAFKCLGAPCQKIHQEFLEKAHEEMRNNKPVPVRLVEEADNPKDPNAICFHICVGNCWGRVGYIASELTPFVKEALRMNRIVSVSVKWIKYRFWPRSGIGFYAAMLISKRGSWNREVISKSSS